MSKLQQLDIKKLNESGDFNGPSLVLGSADVSFWDLTNAYRTLANEGMCSEIRLISEAYHASEKRRVFSREVSFLVSDILSDREARSGTFGLENLLSTRFWTAVKTGTSEDMRDNWFVGYSTKYTIGVWTGNYSGESTWNASGVSGAAPVWVEVINFLHRNNPGVRKGAPDRLVRREVEFPQGVAPSREEWFIRGT